MKLKALILAMIMLVTSYTCVLASGDTTADIVNADYTEFYNTTEFLDMLDIIDDIDISDPARIPTRAEFTAMIVRMTNSSGMVTDNGGFTDVSSNDTFGKYIYQAQSLGIISGGGDGRFLPDDPIAYEAAVKMATVALGYEERAKINGGYPQGYLICANRIDILDGVSSKFTMQDAVTLIYNSLHADILNITSIGEDDISYGTSKGVNFLTDRFKLTRTTGVAMVAGAYSASKNRDSVSPEFEINGSVYTTSIDGAEKYLGYEVDAWYDSKNEVVAVHKTLSNKAVSIHPDDIISYSNNTIKTEADGKENSHKLDAAYTYVLNGRGYIPGDSAFGIENGLITLVSNDGDRVYDFAVVSSTEFFVVSALNDLEKIAYDKNYSGVDSSKSQIDFSESADVYTIVNSYSVRNSLYTSANFDDITVGDVLEVKRSADNKCQHIIILKDNILTGKVDEIGEDGIIISDTSYELSNYYNEHSVNITPGLEISLLLSSNNKVVTDTDISSRLEYGYLLGYGANAGDAFAKPQIKLLNVENKVCVYDFNDSVIFDGDKVSSASDTVKDTLVSNNVPNYQLIRYRLDSEGKIAAIDTADKPLVDTGSVVELGITDDELTQYVSKMATLYKGSSSLIVPYGSISQAVVFCVPEKLSAEGNTTVYDDNMFYCSNRLRNDDKPLIDVFDYKENYYAGAAVVYNVTGGSSGLEIPDKTDTSYMVDEVTIATDIEGMETAKLYLYSSDDYVTYVIDNNVYSELLANNINPQKGDIIRIVTDYKNEISGLAIDVRPSFGDNGDVEFDIAYGENGMSELVIEQFTYASGNVVSADGLLTLNIKDKAPNMYNMPDLRDNKLTFSTNAKYAILYSGNNQKVRQIKLSDIISEQNSGGSTGDVVVVRSAYLNVPAVFIYRNN